MRSWRNWQTHQLEGLAVAIPWWFESTRPHQNFPLNIFVPSKSNDVPRGNFRVLNASAEFREIFLHNPS
jgi:hypothetical protein